MAGLNYRYRAAEQPDAWSAGGISAMAKCRKSPYLPVAFCLDLPPGHRYYPRTLRQAVSFQGSERITPSLAVAGDAGTNLDQCRSDAVDQSRNCQTIFRLVRDRGIEFGYTTSPDAFGR